MPKPTAELTEKQTFCLEHRWYHGELGDVKKAYDMAQDAGCTSQQALDWLLKRDEKQKVVREYYNEIPHPSQEQLEHIARKVNLPLQSVQDCFTSWNWLKKCNDQVYLKIAKFEGVEAVQKYFEERESNFILQLQTQFQKLEDVRKANLVLQAQIKRVQKSPEEKETDYKLQIKELKEQIENKDKELTELKEAINQKDQVINDMEPEEDSDDGFEKIDEC